MAKTTRQLPTLSVSQLNRLIQVTLDESLPPRLMLRGEISDFKRAASGHCYFLLKDTDGQIPCVMWSSKFRNVKFRCENGLAVIATGHVEVYVPGGKYQFYAEKLEPAGVGALQLAFEQMRKRLAAEGLFDEAIKKALPRYPMNIAVVTSGSGAAIHDIQDSIYNRWPCAKLVLFDTPVQGEGAAAKIAAAIARANRLQKQNNFDVLIVGRGGGSMEDLWAFNEEPVARAIFASKLPVISAVGHEVDVTIADLVADARASTPTKAGVIAVPDYREELAKLDSFGRRLHLNVRSVVQYFDNRLRTVLASRVFRTPLGPVQVAAQRVDELQSVLKGSFQRRFVRLKERIDHMRSLLQRIEPIRVVAGCKMEIQGLEARNRQNIGKVLAKKQLQLTALENRLQALNPRSVLERGYSITMNERTGRVVADVADVRVGDVLRTELARNRNIHSRVEDID